MSKKFGKFLFGTAVIGTVAAAAAYYYYQKKEEETIVLDEGGEETDAPKRSYTSLDDISEVAKKFTESAKTTASKVSKSAKDAYSKVKDKIQGSSDDLDDLFEDFEDEDAEDDFTPLSETAKDVSKKADEAGKTVEEFFDDTDNAEGTSEEVKK
ncbi:MAG: hypothetical protein K5871_08645 [Lachnospiraceae bacterium]|nr:hypothetical protein [Lachnospiraceae bacterium]